MNDVSSNLQPSAHATPNQEPSKKSPLKPDSTIEQLCDEEATKLPDTSVLKKQLTAIQDAAKLGKALLENDVDAPPTPTQTTDPASLAKKGSVLHEQHSFSPQLEKKSAGLLTAFIKPTDSRSSASMKAIDTLANKPAATEPKIKSFFSKLLAPNKNAAEKTPKNPLSSRISIDLSEDEAPTIGHILEEGKKLFGSTETLANTCRNLVDVLDLSLPKGMSVHDFSKQLIGELADFKQAVEAEITPLPKVQGKDVPKKDVNALKNLAGQVLVNTVWEGLFTDVIQRKDDQKNFRAFLSPTVLEAMSLIKNSSDTKLLAAFLMSECTTNAGIARVVQPEALKTLLNDPRIISKPQLQNSIRIAASTVMHEAIRRCQSNIVFQEVKASGRPDWKSDLQTWENTAKQFGQEHHDLEGINLIAKKAGIKLRVKSSDKDANHMDLQQVIQIKHAVNDVIASQDHHFF